MQINPLLNGNTATNSQTTIPIRCSGKHASGKANRSLPNNIGQLSKPFQCTSHPPPPPPAGMWLLGWLQFSNSDIFTNISTKPQLSPPKISHRLKSMKGNLLSGSTCGGDRDSDRDRPGCLWRGCWDLIRSWPAGCCGRVWQQRSVVTLNLHSQAPHPYARCCITLQVDVGYGLHSLHPTVWVTVPWPLRQHPNLIISGWIKLSDYIVGLSKNSGNEETPSEAGMADCDSVEDW